MLNKIFPFDKGDKSFGIYLLIDNFIVEIFMVLIDAKVFTSNR